MSVMDSDSPEGMLEEIRSDEAKKARALRSLFDVVASGSQAVGKIPDYIQSSGDIPADAYVAACSDVRDHWTNTFSPPQPGHIREAARRYLAKSRQEIRYVQDKERMRIAKANQMTPEGIRVHLKHVANVPLPDPDTDNFEWRVETKRRASLQRILDGIDGKPAPKRAMRQRGQSGLQQINTGDLV